MPGTVIGKSLNLGYVGGVSRNPMNKITNRKVKSIVTTGSETLASIPFGFAAVLNTDNSYSKFGDSGSGVANPTLANFAGVAVAEVKQATTYPTTSANGAYAPGEPADVIQFGSVTVLLKDGTPTAGGTVHICTVAGGAIAVGDFVTSTGPTGGGTAIALTGTKFTTGKVDANGVCEITLTVVANA